LLNSALQHEGIVKLRYSSKHS